MYQTAAPFKSIESIIKATKLTEHYRLKTYKGKMLKFIAKLRQCELYIYLQRYDLGIVCAQQVLSEVMVKLTKNNKKKVISQLGMAAVTAFYRIGICEESRGFKKAADLAYENANILGQKYLNKDNILLELDYEMIIHRKLNKSRSCESLKKKKSLQPVEKEEVLIEKEKSIVNEKIFLKKEVKIIERKTNPAEEDQEKTFGRYYSAKKLERYAKILKDQANPTILNADKFFFNKISKNLAISSSKNFRNNSVKDTLSQE